jgi:hypothetical protein
VIRAFALFIALFGLGNFLAMLAFFPPLYRLSEHVLIATGVVSWWNVWLLYRAWPTFLAMRGPDDLEPVIAARTEELTNAIEQLRRAETDRADMATIVEPRGTRSSAKTLRDSSPPGTTAPSDSLVTRQSRR